ncbi:AP-5 complex subunit beta-1 [Bienertia sinuspersici]
MERLPSRKNHLTVQEWESLIDDFQQGGFHGGEKWFSSISPLSLLDLALSSLLKKDFPLSLKTYLLIFLDEFADQIFTSDDEEQLLSKLIETLKVVIQSPIDGVSINYTLKEQMLVSVTSITMTIHSIGARVRVHKPQLEGLVAILLAIINRPNHGVDRQTRAVACECLRELEREYPCLLADIVGHLWGLCQNERTHASQSYLLLLLQVIYHIVDCKLNVASVFSTAVPLVPFNVPPWVATNDVGDDGGEEGGLHFGVEMSSSASKELKRVMAFLLEWPKVFTPCGMVEFMSMLMPLAIGLELQSSLLKVQFSGLLYSYNPLFWHVVLILCRRFLDTFEDQEGEYCRRLMLISKEAQLPLVFRLLALHWLLGFVDLISEKDVGKKSLVIEMRSNFYPNVYDALALKSLKLDLLAFCSVIIDSPMSLEGVSGESVVKYFEDGFVCVSGFKWLPPWSTETAVAFRTFYKFLIGASSHSNADPSASKAVMESAIFRALQSMLVNLLLDFQKLVPVAVALIDRLLSCQQHCCLGEKLLQTVDEHLLSKVIINYRMSSYFLLFDRIGKNDSVPPQRLLELLTKFTIFLVEKHGPDTELKSWHQGSKVLGICRTMLLHHHSSRLFIGLSRLLAFTSLYFPDLEVRDNARIYLRMLICVPGKKLRNMLNLGDQLVGISPSSHANSLYNIQSPRFSDDLKKSRSIASYVHLERVIPLLVKQSWSLSLPVIGYSVDKNPVANGIKNGESQMNGKGSDGIRTTEIVVPDNKRIEQPQEPLRVMDSKISEIVDILRQHFMCIPDFRHMLGIKIRISCFLRFKSEPFNRVWGSDSSKEDGSKLDTLPAMYGIVLKFSSSAPYGSIPSFHIPFLLGESTSKSFQKKDSMDIVPVGSSSSEKSVSKSPVTIELEPREPVPGLVDISLDANADDGQIIQGKLQGVPVGIEDMFLKTFAPAEILEDELPGYYARLFDALWEACGAYSNTGRETFSLKGSKGFAAIHGTQSVKLLEVPSAFAIRVVERHLAPFVVGVVGGPLVEVVKDGGLIKDTAWIDVSSEENDLVTNPDGGPLYLTYLTNEDDKGRKLTIGKTNMGCFLVLVFLPPRYHLLFRMEVSDVSTLVRIRTDHWPCLAYIDEYLETLFLS